MGSPMVLPNQRAHRPQGAHNGGWYCRGLETTKLVKGLEPPTLWRCPVLGPSASVIPVYNALLQVGLWRWVSQLAKKRN